MRFARSFAFAVTSFAIVTIASACHERQPATSATPIAPLKSVGACEDACRDRAANHCSAQECHRGCTFILDRLVENEGAHVLACVVASRDKCDDDLWGNCAVRVGEHADGGPPAPPPPDDE